MQAIRFFMSSNLTVQGLKVKDSPQFHFRFDGCQNIRIQSLTIKSPSQSPNTDGIHIENTKNVGIYDSVITNGNQTAIKVSLTLFCRLLSTRVANYLGKLTKERRRKGLH